MSIIYDKEKQVFRLDTRNTTYQFRVAEFGFLEHLYYGRRIPDTAEYLPVRIRHGFEANPHEAEKDRTISLDLIEQEYPGFGVSDFKVAAVSVINGDGSNCIDLRYVSHRIMEGKYSLNGMPSLREQDGSWKTLEVVLRDPYTDMEVTLVYGVLEEHDIITRCARIRNMGKGTVYVNAAHSACISFPTDHMDMISFYGSWGHERCPERTPVRHGKITVDSVRGISSHYQNPSTVLCAPGATEDSGDCWGIALVYSGNFAITVEVNDFKQTRLVAGVNPETLYWELETGGVFETPEAVMTYSALGLTGMSHNFHRAVKYHLIPKQFIDQRCPVLINNWEATMIDFDEEMLVDIAGKAKELGVEMFVMDDGWFGRRTDEYRGLGDWQCNLDKLPSGIPGFARRIHEKGLKFGIWIEPEMVNEDSRLYEEHPDWCIRIPGRKPTRQRYQLILDFSRDEVVDQVFEQLYEEFKDARIDYIKWDMNRSMTDRFSAALPARRQGELCHRYVLGLYRLMDKLTRAFPGIRFEGCSGGGGRFDMGILYYMPQIWCSDDTDAMERILIQYGTSMIYPPFVMGAHVSECPNQQTGRTVSIDTRAALAYFGTFGYELDLNLLSEEEQEAVRKQVRYYKDHGLVCAHGDHYRLTDPEKEREYTAFMSVSADKKAAVVAYVQRVSGANKGIIYIKLKGLEEQSLYEIPELGLRCSGAALMYAGLPMPVIKADNEARVFTLCAG